MCSRNLSKVVGNATTRRAVSASKGVQAIDDVVVRIFDD
jgi:hypothetical protein